MAPGNFITKPSGWVGRWLTPSMADVFFAALFLAVFARPPGLEALLSDGDTGWHIRVGELVLKTGHVPTADPFSFSRQGAPWFAWEWGSDVLFGLLYRWRGLGAVAAMAGVTLALGAAALFARLLRRGTGLWLSLAAALAAASASTIHYLARPHVFSILLYTVALGILEEDRRRPGWRIWMLAPLAALWANLHAGFVVLPATLVLAAVCRPPERRRYSLVAAGCAAATLLNPYGWRLHQHIWRYLNSSWILDHVREFQSPSIRSEGTLVFAMLLLGAVALAWRADRFEAALVLVWGFASMRSARHIPFFAMVAAPVIAQAAADWWRGFAERARPQSAGRILWELAQDLGRRSGFSAWLPAAAAVALCVASSEGAGFPERQFPERAVGANLQWLAPAAADPPRILTSDQWGDYLIFRLYPRQHVFFDGRSDFYGEGLGGDYRKLMGAEDGWPRLLEHYGFSRALLPHDWPLSTILDREPGWRVVYRDSVAVLYARRESVP